MPGKTALTAFLALSLSFPAYGQFAARADQVVKTAESLTSADMAVAAQRYFRDTAELPMLQTTTVSVASPGGRARKPRTVATNYIFHGYSRDRRKATVNISGNESFWAALTGSKMIKTSLNGALWTMFPGLWLYSDPGEYPLSATSEQPGGLIRVKLATAKPCPEFTMDKFSWSYVPDQTCGSVEFQLDENLAVQKFSFDAPGLPVQLKLAPLGRCALLGYHVDIDFQSVALPEEESPFLVPRQVITTMESDKGRIVIKSLFQPKPSAAQARVSR